MTDVREQEILDGAPSRPPDAPDATDMADADLAGVADAEQVADELEAFLRAQFPGTTAGGVDHGADLFESGVVDSVGVAETIAYLEQRYRIRIPDEVLVSDEFTTVSGIARTVARLAEASRPT